MDIYGTYSSNIRWLLSNALSDDLPSYAIFQHTTLTRSFIREMQGNDAYYKLSNDYQNVERYLMDKKTPDELFLKVQTTKSLMNYSFTRGSSNQNRDFY